MSRRVKMNPLGKRKISSVVPEDKKSKNVVKKRNPDSLVENAKLISKYHAVLKYLAQVKVDANLNKKEKEEKIMEYEKQLEEMGGIDAYQKASLQGESSELFQAFNASKWVLTHELVTSINSKSIRLLDVGAIKNHYTNLPNINAVAIDLHPQDVTVLEHDFLLYNNSELFDIIVLSLVVNFEGDPRRRGEMLLHAHTLLNNSGLMFLVLPLACVENSRYCNVELLVEMVESIGFVCKEKKQTNKLAMFVFYKVPEFNRIEFKRTEIREGVNRNNFCIILKSMGKPKIKSKGKNMQK